MTGTRPPFRHRDAHHYESQSPRRNNNSGLLYNREVVNELDAVRPRFQDWDLTNDEAILNRADREEAHSLTDSNKFSEVELSRTTSQAHLESSMYNVSTSASCYLVGPKLKPSSYPLYSLLVSETTMKKYQAKTQHMDYIGSSKTVLVQIKRSTDLSSSIKPFYYNAE